MRPVAQGRPGTQVIPDGWSAAHRPVVNKTHGATVSLRRPGGTKGPLNPTTGKYDFVPHEPYATNQPARIQVLATEDQAAVVGGQEVSVLGYALQLEHDVTGVHLEDVITVTAMDDNGDADLVGGELIVQSFETGSLHWERRLICTRNLETPST